ncbi:MAG: PAS domain-containing protein [Acidobacteriota bacterium]
MDNGSTFNFLEPVLDQVASGVTIADATRADLPLVFVNRVFEEMTGYQRGDILGSNCRFLQGPATEASAVADLRRAIRAGEAARVTLLNYRRDGSTFWNELQLTPVRNAIGRLTHYIGVQTDVTANRRLDQLVQLSAELDDGFGDPSEVRAMRQVLAQVPFGVLLIEADLSVAFANRAALALLDIDADGWQGRRLGALMDTGPLERFLPLPASVREKRLDLPVGNPSVPVGLALVRIGVGPPNETRHILVFRPIAELHSGHQDFEQLRRLSALGHMAAGFAHQIRNPLAAVRSLAEALHVELGDDDDRQEYTERMLSLVGRVEAMVRRSLRFTRGTPARRQSVAPAQLVADTLRLLERLWHDTGIAPRVSVPAELPQVMIDPDHGIEILEVLIENAVDATGRPDQVAILGSGPVPGFGATAGRFVMLEIVDQGPGMSAETLGQIFDPFFTTKPRGTGLGLPIAMRLAEENAALLEVSTTEGVGTHFRLRLPTTEAGDT